MLRTLLRDKANLVAESADWVRRMQKSLDQMNVHVHRAVSELNGVTGMAIVRAIADAQCARLLQTLEGHQANVNCTVWSPPWARTLTGGSTGGWESLALQVCHSDFFGGVWTFY